MITRLKRSIETRFSRFGEWGYDHPLPLLVCVSVFICFLSLQILHIDIDTSAEALLHPSDSSLMKYNAFRDRFGRAELVIVAVEGDDLFAPDFIHRLRAFHEALEQEVPYVHEVTSLINVRDTRGDNDTLTVEGLLENWPGNGRSLADIRARALASPLYRDYLLSADGRITAVVLETDAVVDVEDATPDPLGAFEDVAPAVETEGGERYFGAEENREVVDAVNRVVAAHQHSDFRLVPSGGPIIGDAFNRATMVDIQRCIVLSLVVVALFLTLLFRRVSGVVLPVVIILASLASTMGLMALFKVPIKITTTVVPAFLLSVSVADSVHILAIFYRHFAANNGKRAAIAFAMGHSGLAVVMTSLTTAAGLLSFALADLGAIAEIGYFAAGGVMLALVYTVTLLPAMLAFVPLHVSGTARGTSRFMDRLLIAVARIGCRRPFAILAVGGIFAAGAFFSLFSLSFSHNVVTYFPVDSPVRTNLMYIDRHLNGSITLELVVDTKKDQELYEPATLRHLDLFAERIRNTRHESLTVGKIISINDIVKEIHHALNDERPEMYVLPQERGVIAQELLLFENSGAEDLEKLVDNSFSRARLTVRAPWVDAVVCRDFISLITDRFEEIFADGAELTVTGLMALLARAISAAIVSMAKSYVVAFGVICIMMILLLGSIRTGLLSMIPNLLPILLIMGLMGSLDVPLDLNSLMIGSIAIGLVVDDTVHFMYNYQRYYDESGSVERAVQETLLGTGRAMLITSLVLTSGFFVLLAASLNHLVRFGTFTGITILLALVGDFLVVPALLTLIHRRRQASC